MEKIIKGSWTLIILSIFLFTDVIAEEKQEEKLATKCPSSNLLSPCICEEITGPNQLRPETIISCHDTNQDYFISTIFATLSASLPQDKLHFTWFYLNNTAISELSEDIFGDVTFENVILDGTSNLTSIHENAFTKMSSKIKYIYAWRTNLSDEYRINHDDGPFANLESLIGFDLASNEACPQESRLSPCYCVTEDYQIGPIGLTRSKTKIICNSTSANTDLLLEVFASFSEAELNSSRSLYYDELLITDNQVLTELTEVAFGVLQFGHVRIENCPHLSSVQQDAFGEGSRIIQFLSIAGADFSSSETNESDHKIIETFTSLNHMRNLHFLFFYSTNLTHIPANAFQLKQPHLRSIYLYGNQIKSIGSFAFSYLPRLEKLVLDGNKLNHISKYAFETIESSLKPLEINLVANPLHSESFEFGAFSGAQRPVKLIFADASGCQWNMMYLEETVFAPFLDKENNHIYIEPECELICDCKMKWLLDAPHHLKEKISVTPYSKHNFGPDANKYNLSYVPCAEGQSLFDMMEDEFDSDCK